VSADVTTKICGRCANELPATSEHFSTRDGALSDVCQSCHMRERKHAWYVKNAERVKAVSKAWRERKPERTKELIRLWKEKYPDKVREHTQNALKVRSQRKAELEAEVGRLRSRVSELQMEVSELRGRIAELNERGHNC
jgi:septal ring factor EnvC (AmiA/AmiB activator)